MPGVLGSLFWSIFCEIVGPVISSIPEILIPDVELSANPKESKPLIVLVRFVSSNQRTCLLACSWYVDHSMSGIHSV